MPNRFLMLRNFAENGDWIDSEDRIKNMKSDFKPHESPMQHGLVSDPWVQENGYVAIRDVPGLGVTVREDVIEKNLFG